MVEMLVAIAISILLVILMGGIVSQSMGVARKSRNRLQALNSAAAAIDLITGDLDGLSASRQPFEYLQAFIEPVPIGPGGATCTPMRLLMLTCSAEDASTASTEGGVCSYPESGLIHAVSYSILYQDPLGGTNNNNTFGLYRAVASSSNTFGAILGGTNEYTRFWNGSAASISALVRNPQPQAGIRADFVAPNVVDLEVAVDGTLVSSATAAILTGSSQIVNPSQAAGYPFSGVQLTGTGALVGVAYNPSGAMTSAGTAPSVASLPNGVAWGPAAYAEVSVTVLEQEGATQWAPGANSGALSIATLKQKYGHTLTRKILLRPPQ